MQCNKVCHFFFFLLRCNLTTENRETKQVSLTVWHRTWEGFSINTVFFSSSLSIVWLFGTSSSGRLHVWSRLPWAGEITGGRYGNATDEQRVGSESVDVPGSEQTDCFCFSLVQLQLHQIVSLVFMMTKNLLNKRRRPTKSLDTPYYIYVWICKRGQQNILHVPPTNPSSFCLAATAEVSDG